MITCHASVDNRSNNEIKPVTVSLVQAVTFRGVYYSYEKKKHVKRNVVTTKFSQCVAPHSHEDWTHIRLLIPAVCSSTLGGSHHHQRRLIHVSYSLVFNFDPAGMHVSKTLTIPIVIGTVPLHVDPSVAASSVIAPPPPYSCQASVFDASNDVEEPPPQYDEIKGDVVESDSKTFRPHYLYFYSLSG